MASSPPSSPGSSLPQARYRLAKHHNHLYLHENYNPDSPSSPSRSRPDDEQRPALELRQDPVADVITEVVTQVVTVIPGAVSAAAAVADSPLANPGVPTTLPAVVAESTPQPQLSTLNPGPPGGGPAATRAPSSEPARPDASLSQAATLTSALSTDSSAFPTFSAPFNITGGRFNQSIFSNSSGAIRPFAISSSSASSGFLNYTTLSTISLASSTSADSIDVTVIPTAGLGSGSGSNGAGPSPSGSATTGDGGSQGSPSTTLTPQQAGTIAGGVIGAAAGAAVLVFLVMLALRWKRRQQALLTGDGRGQRLLTAGDGGDDSNGGGMSMARDAPTLPFGLPATLVGLGASRSRHSQKTLASDSSEKGFYRVSGRKLEPVLSSGGDGYSDPRESIMSDASVYYRDSTAFFDPTSYDSSNAAATTKRLALGSPMRPVSGVPIMRSGPARTPQTETSSFAWSAPQTPSTTHTARMSAAGTIGITPPRRELGRSLTSFYEDEQGGSPSRFTEQM